MSPLSPQTQVSRACSKLGTHPIPLHPTLSLLYRLNLLYFLVHYHFCISRSLICHLWQCLCSINLSFISAWSWLILCVFLPVSLFPAQHISALPIPPDISPLQDNYSLVSSDVSSLVFIHALNFRRLSYKQEKAAVSFPKSKCKKPFILITPEWIQSKLSGSYWSQWSYTSRK